MVARGVEALGWVWLRKGCGFDGQRLALSVFLQHTQQQSEETRAVWRLESVGIVRDHG